MISLGFVIVSKEDSSMPHWARRIYKSRGMANGVLKRSGLVNYFNVIEAFREPR